MRARTKIKYKGTNQKRKQKSQVYVKFKENVGAVLVRGS